MRLARPPASLLLRAETRRYLSDHVWTPARRLWWLARRENVPRLAAAGVSVTVILAAVCFAFEHGPNRHQFQSIGDALWWACVTVMTVGYGDKYPITWPGRFLAVCLMVFGFLAMTFFTGAIASVLVERKMREDEGLGQIGASGHFVVCGWNQHAERIIQELLHRRGKGAVTLVLVNDLEKQEISEIAFAHPDAAVRFVKGDFTHETTLKRANVAGARAVILLADSSKGGLGQAADQRTIIAALAVKSVAPDVATCAELLDPENREHLERAKVDSIIISGEHSGFLLANATLAPAIPAAVGELLTGSSGHALTQVPIPDEFVGRRVRDLLAHFRERQALLVGLVRQRKGITLDDILASDLSPIDQFIRQQFEESEKDYFGDKKKQGVALSINPPDDYVLRDDEDALVIGRPSAR